MALRSDHGLTAPGIGNYRCGSFFHLPDRPYVFSSLPVVAPPTAERHFRRPDRIARGDILPDPLAGKTPHLFPPSHGPLVRHSGGIPGWTKEPPIPSPPDHDLVGKPARGVLDGFHSDRNLFRGESLEIMVCKKRGKSGVSKEDPVSRFRDPSMPHRFSDQPIRLSYPVFPFPAGFEPVHHGQCFGMAFPPFSPSDAVQIFSPLGDRDVRHLEKTTRFDRTPPFPVLPQHVPLFGTVHPPPFDRPGSDSVHAR